MLLYETNLAEKLFGYAISREFIKYSSPLCNLLDDPILGVDFELAINFNQAINGNEEAVTNFTNTFMLCSSYLNIATIKFYTNKMQSYPIFTSEIGRMNYMFTNWQSLPVDNTSFGKFNARFKSALKDCINSPCNPFSPISESMGRITQGTAGLNSSTALSFGSLKDSFASIKNGLDDAIFNKIPKAFQMGIGQISKACSDTNGLMQAAFINPEDQVKMIDMIQRGESPRSMPNNFRYTPDVKSFFDINAVGSNVLANLAADLGGCFSRYEHAVRYNPYDSAQNLRTATNAPIEGQINGASYSRDSMGKYTITTSTNDQRTGYNATTPIAPYNGETLIGDPVEYGAPGSGSPGKWTTFGGWVDDSSKLIYVDNTDIGPSKPLTQRGTASIGERILTPSFAAASNVDHDQVVKALNKQTVIEGDGYAARISQGATTNTDLTKLDNTKFNHGCAISPNTFSQSVGKNILGAKFIKLAKQNAIWAYIETSNFKGLVQMVDSGPNNILDLTPLAFKKVTGSEPRNAKRTGRKYGEWTEVDTASTWSGKMIVRYCVGNKADVLAKINGSSATESTAATPAVASPASTSGGIVSSPSSAPVKTSTVTPSKAETGGKKASVGSGAPIKPSKEKMAAGLAESKQTVNNIKSDSQIKSDVKAIGGFDKYTKVWDKLITSMQSNINKYDDTAADNVKVFVYSSFGLDYSELFLKLSNFYTALNDHETALLLAERGYQIVSNLSKAPNRPLALFD